MDELMEVLEEILPDGWEHDADTFGMDFTLYCPHGHNIEQDGSCCDGCISPLRELGFI